MNTRVAILDPLGSHGGMHYYDHDLASSLTRAGVEVDIFSPSPGLNLEQTYRSHVYFENVYGPEGGSKVRRAYRLSKEIIRSLRAAKKLNCNAVILHIFKSDIFELLIVRVAKFWRMRVYAIVHDVSRLDAPARFEFQTSIVKSAEALVVHNEYSKNALLKVNPLAAAKTAVIPHGNYVSQFPLIPTMKVARDILSISEEVVVLLFFGNPRREKGLALLLEALEPFKNESRLLLLVAGKMKSEEEQLVTSQLANLGIQERVRMSIGHVPDEMIPVYFGASSIVVLPYHRVYESGVALMAMTLGRAILASDLPVFNELLAASGGGVSFKSENVASLSAEIAKVLNGYTDHEALGLTANRFVWQQRDWTGIAKKWKALFNYE